MSRGRVGSRRSSRREITKELIATLVEAAAVELDEAITRWCSANREWDAQNFDNARYWEALGDDRYHEARGLLRALSWYKAIADRGGEWLGMLFPSNAIGIYLWARWFIHLGHAPHVAEQTTGVEVQS